jgi:hypothetical protein
MPDIFERGHQRDPTPVRRRQRLRYTADEDGNPAIQPVASDAIGLSPEDSIDTTTAEFDAFYHCGCPMQAAAGGRCAEGNCGRISCQRCCGRCANCQKPLCLEHSRFVAMGNSATIRLCFSCHGTLRRQRILATIGHVLLTPFVDFGDRPAR